MTTIKIKAFAHIDKRSEILSRLKVGTLFQYERCIGIIISIDPDNLNVVPDHIVKWIYRDPLVTTEWPDRMKFFNASYAMTILSE